MNTIMTAQELEDGLQAAMRFEQLEDERQQRLNAAREHNRQRPEAARFGAFDDWAPEDVDYLLEELRVGHNEDLSHAVNGGWLLAASGLEVAQIATEFEDAGKLKRVLEALREGLRWQIENETTRLREDDEEGQLNIDRAQRVLDAIEGAYDEAGRVEQDPTSMQ